MPTAFHPGSNNCILPHNFHTWLLLGCGYNFSVSSNFIASHLSTVLLNERSQEDLPRIVFAPDWTTQTLTACLRKAAPALRGLLVTESYTQWLCCNENPRAGCSTPEQSRGKESPPLMCWSRCFLCSTGYNWFSGLQALIAASCPTFHPTLSIRLFSMPLPLARVGTRAFPNQSAGLCIWPCWTLWGVPMGTLLKFVQVPLHGVHPSVCHPHCSAVVCKFDRYNKLGQINFLL